MATKKAKAPVKSKKAKAPKATGRIPPGLEHLWADGRAPTREDVLAAWEGPVENDWPSWNVYTETGEPVGSKGETPTASAKALATLTGALQADADYARGWHDNLAMAFRDAGGSRAQAIEGASRFMKLAFKVDTSPTAEEALAEKRARGERSVTITQANLANQLDVGLEGITLIEAYNGIGFKTPRGYYGVCMRDEGIEVLLDGKSVYPSTSIFPVTIHDYERGRDLYTLDIDGHAGGNAEGDQGDGFPAYLTMSQTFPDGKGIVTTYHRAAEPNMGLILTQLIQAFLDQQALGEKLLPENAKALLRLKQAQACIEAASKRQGAAPVEEA